MKALRANFRKDTTTCEPRLSNCFVYKVLYYLFSMRTLRTVLLILRRTSRLQYFLDFLVDTKRHIEVECLCEYNCYSFFLL
jgi:hypothetical protein